MIKVSKMTTHEARRLVQDCFVQEIAKQESYGAFVPMTSQTEFEYHEQRVLSEDRITDLKAQVSGNRFDDDIRHRVRDLVIRHGYGPHELPDARLNDLANGVARVLVERQRLFLLRLEDRLAPIVVTDDIFRNDAESSCIVEYGTKFKGPLLAEAIDSYLETYKPVWKLKTYKARLWQLRYLVEYLGDKRPIARV